MAESDAQSETSRLSPPDQEGSRPAFWDAKYEGEEPLFGTQPNAFIAEQARRIPSGARVVELGAGEARNLIYLAERYAHRGTAVDFSQAALQQARALAEARDTDLRTIHADLRTWSTDERWDAVIVTFVQLLPAERPPFYRLIRRIVRPGGWVIAEWFCPDHIKDDYASIGPPVVERMIAVDELHEHFAGDRILQCEPTDVHLEEGPVLRGRAAVIRFVAQRGRGDKGR